MKYLKSLSLIIFLLFNLNCFAKEVQDISNTETLNFDTKNKENTTEEHDVPDYISNPKEHAEKFVDEASKTILTVLVFFGFILSCWFFGDAESPARKGSSSRKSAFIKPFEPSRSSSASYRYLPSNIHYRK